MFKNKIMMVLAVWSIAVLCFTGIACAENNKEIIANDIVGIWEFKHTTAANASNLEHSMEFFDDETGLMVSNTNNLSFTWKLRNGNRLQILDNLIDIKLSDNGTLLMIGEAQYEKK